MTADNGLHGLSCPRCGGMVPIPEGQTIVICPFCSQRSIVRGESGVMRYQVPNQIDRQRALDAFEKFLRGNMAISASAAKQAEVSEVLLVHLPFWAVWGRVVGWVFGQKEQGSGKNRHYVAKEVRCVEEMTWNNAACDVGEFGVNRVSLENRPLEAFHAEGLHATGMVFEPVGSAEEARAAALNGFTESVTKKANLDRVAQSFVRVVRPRLGLVYYPLWVVRYLYRGRSFQVVVDGFNGSVIYGKAPGNVLYRAAVLVGGMALGSFLSVDVAYLFLASGGDDSAFAGLFALGAGFVLMYLAYRKFRYGEHYEYQRYKTAQALDGVAGKFFNKPVEQVNDFLQKFSGDE